MSEHELTDGEWEAQQDQIDEWVIQFSERLALDKAQVTKALTDWVYVNTDTDWLEFAAKDDAVLGEYGGELGSFLEAATRAWEGAWEGAWGKKGERTVSDVLKQIEDLIAVYRQGE